MTITVQFIHSFTQARCTTETEAPSSVETNGTNAITVFNDLGILQLLFERVLSEDHAVHTRAIADFTLLVSQSNLDWERLIVFALFR